MAVELVSDASRAMRTTGTGVAVLAVLGLYTRVLISSKSAGALGEEVMAARHAAGEVVGSCESALDPRRVLRSAMEDDIAEEVEEVEKEQLKPEVNKSFLVK